MLVSNFADTSRRVCSAFISRTKVDQGESRMIELAFAMPFLLNHQVSEVHISIAHECRSTLLPVVGESSAERGAAWLRKREEGRRSPTVLPECFVYKLLGPLQCILTTPDMCWSFFNIGSSDSVRTCGTLHKRCR